MKANRSGRTLDRDDEGSFIVLEAILVAALVLTAILFFTSVQRPTTGSEAGGLDLARYAGDTLRLLQVHDFDGKEFEEWVTSVAEAQDADDLATADEVDEYLSEIVPGGVKYSLRLHNGVAPQQLLPTGATEIPRAARAASISFLPDWAEFEDQVPTRFVTPGQFIASTDTANSPLVNPLDGTYSCFESPNGSVTLRDGPDADSPAAADTWASHWKAAPDPTDATSNTPWKATQFDLGAGFQVPTDLPYGIWRLSGTVGDDADGNCDAVPTFVNVIPPGSVRVITGAETYAAPVTRLTSVAYQFTNADVGLPVAGPNILDGSTIASVASGEATLSLGAIAAGSSLVIGLGIDSPYRPYTLELVLWFGA